MIKRSLAPLLALLLLLTTSAAFATGPARVIVSDTVYAPDGSLMNGVVKITNTTFTSADGFVVAAGSILTQVVNGVLSVSLVPTVGSTPVNEFYKVDYGLNIRTPPVTEFWIVPSFNTNLAGVRTGSPPLPGVMIAMSQMVPPQPCLDGQVPTWQVGTSTWKCQAFAAPGSANLVLLSPAIADTNKIQLQIPFAATLTQIACSTDAGTVDVNFDIRGQSTPGSAGTNALPLVLTCTNSRASTSTFSSSTVALNQVLNLQLAAVNGGAAVVRIYLNYAPQ